MAARRLVDRLRGFLADRATRWARRRQGLDTLPVTLVARRIYIVPTRAGAGLAALLLVMLAAGLNYNNSLALLLTFTLASFALVSLYQCHQHLLGLTVRTLTVEPGFAGEGLPVSVTLVGPGGGPLTAAAGLQAVLRQDGASVSRATLTHASDLTLAAPAPRRGRWQLQQLGLETRAPFGLFRAWVWLHAEVSAIVYPEPRGELPLPQGPGQDAGRRQEHSGVDEWVGLRAFREGDSPRQVAWKAYARGAPLLVREYHELSGDQLVFDIDRLPGLDTEARLSQLARWVLAAEQRGATYALTLGGQHLAAGAGHRHRDACLAALALYGLTDAPGAA